jgi:hypothetical protein
MISLMSKFISVYSFKAIAYRTKHLQVLYYVLLIFYSGVFKVYIIALSETPAGVALS